MKITIVSESDMKLFGQRIGQVLKGNEVIELVGDIGAGKTTLTKGIALGLAIDDDVQSPTFTISRVYDGRDGLRLAHYDFYRLDDGGIMKNELIEATEDPKTIIVIEWARAVEGVLPNDHSKITIKVISENEREVEVTGNLERLL